MDDVANPSPWKSQFQSCYYVYPWTMPSDVPLGSLDTNVVSGHLQMPHTAANEVAILTCGWLSEIPTAY